MLSDSQLRKAAEEMRQDPDGKLPTPGSVFRKLGCRPRCGGCFPSVIDLIHEKPEEAAGRSGYGGKSAVDRDEAGTRETVG
ncbi:hypothetical protein SL003B_3707 [Polymorphum gilvum SL003B-26A1]|uniref:Uncharacterized protein n=1 Tax=Polymorphum gilvum (strain LMG 25793 / CGMCC 1.9160 / SL003B-26A1) TaxID=991905 RepID=F2J2V4_POLGS|nr:hypothetical protein SL003B_3707 [Polymorphum gilvum SL003B-26A1]